MNFIWGMLTGIVVSIIACLVWTKMGRYGCCCNKENPSSDGVAYGNTDETKKKENIAKIENYIALKDKFTNDELQNFLGVSDTTIGRYLDELEKAGKITQVGTGPDTYYTKN
jgi:predicted HTH transcriptional regulator